MARASNISVKFEIEPICKVTCLMISCRHNLSDKGWLCCDLKNIEIGRVGICKQMEVDECIKD